MPQAKGRQIIQIYSHQNVPLSNVEFEINFGHSGDKRGHEERIERTRRAKRPGLFLLRIFLLGTTLFFFFCIYIFRCKLIDADKLEFIKDMVVVDDRNPLD